MILKNATYLNKDMNFVKGNILIDDESLTILDDDFKSDDNSIFNCDDFIILPGLFNSHCHTPSACFRGIFRNVSKDNLYSDTYVNKLYSKILDTINNDLSLSEYRILCEKSYIESIKKGVTFVCDSPVTTRSPFILAEIIKDLGIKACIDAGDNYEKLYFKNDSDVKFFAHLPEELTVSTASLDKLSKLKSSLNPQLCAHYLENSEIKESIHNKFNCSSLSLFDKYNLLDNKTVLFHYINMQNDDLNILKNSNVNVVSCPIATLILGYGVTDINKCIQNNINICLGTGWSFSDIWETMRATYLQLKLDKLNDKSLAESIFKMVTSNSAKALNAETSTGVIDTGFKADLIFINKNDPKLYPIINNETFSNLAENILMECNENMIYHVMCNGKWLVRDKKFLLINEDNLNSQYESIINSILER